MLVVFIGTTLDTAGSRAPASSGTSRLRASRGLDPTRTYVASGSGVEDTLDHVHGTHAGELFGGMLVVAGVLLCASVLSRMRRNGQIRLQVS